MRAIVAAAMAAALLAASGCAIDERGTDPPGSTLDATIRDQDGDGTLERGPGEPLVDRTELAPKGRATRQVVRLGQLSDLHVRDEESPARVPFLDRLGDPVTSTFRPQEALSPQVLTAALRAINTERPDAVLLTGDLLDSAQANELHQLLDVVEGGPVDPGSGRRAYDGVQSASNPDGLFYRPALDAPRSPRLLERAETPFFSPGVRAPWLPVIGNHDVLVQGELPPSRATDAIATGDRALLTFDPALRDLVDRLPAGDRARGADGTDGASASPDLRGVPRSAIEALLAEGVPGDVTTVPADPERRHLRSAELVARLREAAGVPAADPPTGGLDYVRDVGTLVRLVILDTADRAGGAQGRVTARQTAFLRRALRTAGDRAVVVVDHHGLARSRGSDAALNLLAGDPDVVAEVTGDTHRNEIRPVRTRAGGYWRITTASLADWPQQGRMLRLVTGAGGARAIETWMVDQTGGAGGRDLAGNARALSFIDAQGGRPNGDAGRRTDRNVRLWLPPRS